MAKSLLFMIAILLGLTGCGREHEESRTQQTGEMNRLQTELQEIRAEVQHLELARQSAIAEKNQWKSRSIVAISLGTVFLFIGAGLGAGARRDARKRL